MRVSARIVVMVMIVGLLLSLSLPVATRAQEKNPANGNTTPPVVNTDYFTLNTVTTREGTVLEEMIIDGPPTPPAGFDRPVYKPPHIQIMSAKTLTVPAYQWVYGCSAVAGAMIAGYYDNNGYADLYTGPANGGLMPLTEDASWGSWSDGYATYPNNPLVASHNGIDGETTRGSIDDYWVQENSTAQDPYITGSWAQHSWDTAIGDFMKTGQSAYGNVDGSTAFYNYDDTSPAPLTCTDMVIQGVHNQDGTYGRKLFYEARGYTVTDCYNQKTDNNHGGFTFEMYKAQIDTNQPLLLNLQGHSVVGVGYDDSGNTVILHDTWDNSNHTMTWGDGYAGMALLSVSVVNLAPTSHVGTILRVKPGGATSGTCGSDWNTPCDLSYALETISISGDEIWVAGGVYKPTTNPADRTDYFALRAGVAIYGGYAGTEAQPTLRVPHTYVTILSGDIDNNDSQTPIITDANTVSGNTTNSYHVAAGIPTGAILDGLTITGGYGPYGCPYGWKAQYGGGLYTEGAMTLNDLTFSGNRAFYGGGLRTTAPLAITNSTFAGNYADQGGGGLSNGGIDTTLTNVTFTNNRAVFDGGGASNNTTYSGEPSGSLILAGVTFSDNWAGTNAGGLYVEGQATLTDVTFEHNKASNLGGGMAVSGSAPVVLTRVTFKNNYGPTSGGGLGAWSGNITLNDSAFFGNSAVGDGGAIQGGPSGAHWTLNNVLVSHNSAGMGGGISTSTPMSLYNVTLTNNAAGSSSYGGGIASFSTVDVYNSIIWGNTAGNASNICPSGYGGCGTTNVSYSDVQGGWGGTGNVDVDPLLAPVGDYGGSIPSRALFPASPVIDQGDPATCLPSDQRGEARSSPCDLGAFELTNSGAATYTTITSSPNPVAYGASVTFTALVTSTLGTPTGAVQFTADGLPLGPRVTLSGNSASLSTSSLSIGAHTIAATYTGDASHNISTKQLSQMVSCTNALVVTNADDSGTGSLREAFAPLCAGGTITFNADYTLNLASTLLINKSMTISGAGHHITLNGNHALRVLKITAGNVTLDHLTIANGQAPLECGPWTDHCGGGVWTQNSTLIVQHSTFYGNAANLGGSIFNYHPGSGAATILNVRNSTFVGNSAPTGGGIYNSFGTLNINNSTFSGNSATEGAAIYNVGYLNLANSILWGNGSSELAGYIWAGSAGVSYTDIQGGWGGTGNLAVDPLFVDANGPDNISGNADDNLLLSLDSPALDAGDNASCMATDLRGLPRNDLNCDMGAYERVYADGDTVRRGVSSSSLTTFGPALAAIQRDADYADPGVITVTRSTTWAAQGPESIASWWSIEPANDSGINVTLELCYPEALSNSLSLDALGLWRLHEGVWMLVNGDPAIRIDSHGNRCALVSGIQGFSTWTLATGEPTAVTLTQLSATQPGVAHPVNAGRVGVLALTGMLDTAALVLLRRRRRLEK